MVALSVELEAHGQRYEMEFLVWVQGGDLEEVEEVVDVCCCGLIKSQEFDVCCCLGAGGVLP